MKLIFTIPIIILFLVLSGNYGYAQTISGTTYPFTYTSGASLEVPSGAVQLLGANQDNPTIPYASIKNIGFDFWFANTRYTQFSASENGLLKLGSTPVTNQSANAMATSNNLPKIAPYWDDLATGTNGSVSYWVTGTSPNRKLVVQWNVTVPKAVSGAANAAFQAWLYETSGVIEFVYGNGIDLNNGGYSIGIGSSITQYASITSSVPSAVYGTANNNNTTAITAGTKYTFTPVDNAAPAITYTALTNTYLTDNRNITATIIDQSGVPESGSYLPRIYYKKNYTGTYVSTQGVLASGTGSNGTWTFTIDNSLLGGVSGHDTVYYYVAAQDQAGTPNISSLPAGAVGTDVNNIITNPSSPNKYKIGAMLSGTKTVGTSGADYTSLTKAGGLFEDIKDGILSGNLTVNIITDLTAETGAFPISAWVNDANGPYTITINPVGDRIVSGSASALIALNGTKGVIIDGLNSNGNSLTISNTNASTSAAAIKIYNGACNNIVTRTTLKGVVSSSGGVVYFGDASSTSGNNNNSINHCIITSGATTPMNGIYMYPYSGLNSTNNVIDNNVISNFSYKAIHIYMRIQDLTISNNDIYQSSPGSAYSAGVYIDGLPGTINIFNNKIHDLNTTYSTLGTKRAAIQYATGGSTGVLNIYNNTISLDASYTGANPVYGLSLDGAGTSNVYYNSIYIGGSGVSNVSSAGLSRSNGVVDFRNNVIYNARSLSAPNSYYKNYGIQTSNLTNFVSNNNDIYVTGTGGVLCSNGSTDYLTITDWNTNTGQDAQSFSGDPGFTSAADLSPDINNTNSFLLNGHGVPIPGFDKDINGNPRNVDPVSGTTDIGAFEFTPAPVLFTISGNAGTAGAVISWTDGTPQTAAADSTGAFSILVNSGWTGIITPILPGYTFTPASVSYSNLSGNVTGLTFTASSFITVNVKVFLEGAYNNGQMNNVLNTAGLIPLNSETAFPSAANGYTSRTVAGIPDTNIVDWVLVELRTGTAANTKVSAQAGFIKSDGSIVDIDGNSPLRFQGVASGNYYIVVKHRNHLAVMSSSSVSLNNSSALYDFTTALNKAYGNNPMKSLAGGVFGMISGDGNGDGNIDYANDLLTLWLPNFGVNGYYPADYDLNGTVDYNNDVLLLWLSNFGLSGSSNSRTTNNPTTSTNKLNTARN